MKGKTGVEEIAKERLEQLKKHGYTQEHDDQHKGCEIVDAAIFAITLQDKWKQKGWEHFEAKMWNKSYSERVIIAGALL